MSIIAKRIKGITIELDGETRGLDKALQDVNKRSRTLNSELRDVERLLKFDPGNAEAAAQKQKLLADQVENSSEKLTQLRNAQKQVEKQFKSEEIGEDQYRAFKREVQFTEAEVRKFEKRLKEVGNDKSLSKVEKDMEDVSKESKKASKSVDGLGNSFKDAGKKASALGAVGAAAIGGLVTSMEDYNRILARLDTNAVNQGFNPEVMEDYAKRVAAVSGEMDSAIETVSNLMATNMDEAQMAQVIDEINGAAIRFSDTLKTEGIADGLQETFATGQAIGQFGELLERSGVDLEVFNAGLAAARERGDEANYVLEELAKTGLSSAYDEYKRLNPEIYAHQEAQQELTSSLAEFAKNLTPLVTMVMSFLTAILEWANGNIELVRSFDNIGDGLKALFSKLAGEGMNIISALVNGIITNLPALAETGGQILQNIILGIMTALPSLMETWQGILVTQTENFTAFLPQLIGMGIQMIQSLIQGFLLSLPVLTEAILGLLASFVTIVLENIPVILQAGIQILNALVTGLVQAIPQLATTVINILQTVIETIVDNLPLIIESGVQLLTALIGGIISILPMLSETALKLVNKVFEVILNNLPTIIRAGVDLLLALVNGIVNALPSLIQTAVTLIIELAGTLLSNLPKIIAAGIDILLALIEGLIKTIPQLVAAIPQIISAIFDAFGDVDWGEIGINIIEGLIGGVKSMASSLVEGVKGVVGGAIEGAKNLLGINSPSRVFREIGEFTGEGLEIGIKSMGTRVKRAGQNLGKMAIPKMDNIDMPGVNMAGSASYASSGVGGTDLAQLIQAINALANRDTVLEINGREFARATGGDMSKALKDLSDAKARQMGMGGMGII